MTPYYEDDLVTLYHGDCREVTEWLATDLLVTDPPYGLAWSFHGGGIVRDKRGRQDIARAVRGRGGIQNDGDTSARDGALAMWGDGPGLVFGAWGAPFPPHRQVLVWRKSADAGVIGSNTGYRRDTELIFLVGRWPSASPKFSSVLTTELGVRGYATDHPHTKPLGLMQTLINRSPSGSVADPFAGSGATLVAAKHLGRRAVGVEIEEKYCEVAAKRLAQDALFGDAA